MIKQQLEQFKWLELEIKELSAQIERLERRLVRPPSCTIKYAEGSAQREEESPDMLIPLIDVLHEQLKKQMHRAIEYLAQLDHFIESIEDSQTRLIFHLRYVNGLNWTQVAWKMGGNTPDSARMTHNRYLAAAKLKKQAVQSKTG